MASGLYVVRLDNVSISGAITLLQVTAPSNAVLEVERVWVSQSSTTTSAMQRVQILRKTASISGTSVSPTPLDGSGAAASTALVNATGEGTDGAVLIHDSFNVLNGWLYLPVPEERIIVPPSGMIAVKFPAAPTAATDYIAGMVYREVG